MKQKIPSPKKSLFRRLDTPLPSYRYVPGLLPHPFRSLEGHMNLFKPTFPENKSWEKDHQFLYGADLFDHRYYWEAHENWEHCWNKAKGDERICIQGLIQLSASILKHHMDQKSPRDRLFEAASDKLSHGIRVHWDFTYIILQTSEFFEGGAWPVLDREFPKKS